MKTLATSILTFILFSFFAFSTSAQTTDQTADIYLIVNKIDGKIVSKAENGEKTITFDIGGFATKQQVDEFVTKFKTMRGVVSINVVDDAIDGKWNATAVFYKYATKEYFKNLFTWCGVKFIMLDGTKYMVEELQTTKFE